MIVPSIDLMRGEAVQLRNGKEFVLSAGDPTPLFDRFSRVGEVAVIDLDAALGSGDNSATIERLIRRGPCRVGGGIRSVDSALRWLDAGAEKIILGTMATPELLSQLPRKRVVAAVDAVDGDVVTHGWRTKTGRSIEECILSLRPFVSGFLVTFVEREGGLGGTDLERIKSLVALAPDMRFTFAGGITTASEIAAIDSLGADAQVGMAIYKGMLSLSEAFCAPLRSDRPDGLWPTVVCDEHGSSLGLVYSDNASVQAALERGEGVYHSRKRGLWRKGEASGNTQRLLRIEADCDRDALRFVVRQTGPFCHEGTRSCWGEPRGLSALENTLSDRIRNQSPNSYTSRLLSDESLLLDKLSEEMAEFCAAKSAYEIRSEAADVLYFLLVRLKSAGLSLADVEVELDTRRKRVTRRGGERKVPRGDGA